MEIDPDSKFILICPNCCFLAFDPKVCKNCGAKIPPSTRVKVLVENQKLYEITGYEARNLSTATVEQFKDLTVKAVPYIKANIKSTSSARPCDKSKRKPKVKGPSKKSGLGHNHSEKYASGRFLKTAEEVKSDALKAKKNKVKEVVHEDKTHNLTIEEQTAPNDVHSAARDVTIYDKDLDYLDEGELLNDTIIDAYLGYVHYKIVPVEFQERVHIFNTFFYRFLTTTFELKIKGKNRLDVAKCAKKWVKNVDIFAKDLIFVPINKDGHWYLAVICYLSQINKYLNDNSLDVGKNNPYVVKESPCICFFDSYDESIGLEKHKVSDANRFIEYLNVLWATENPAVPYEWGDIPYINVVCPQQDNSFDCGVYLLQFVESFFTTPIHYIGVGMKKLNDWFPPETMKDKRQVIKHVITSLRINQPEQSSVSSDSDIIVENVEDK